MYVCGTVLWDVVAARPDAKEGKKCAYAECAHACRYRCACAWSVEWWWWGGGGGAVRGGGGGLEEIMG